MNVLPEIDSRFDVLEKLGEGGMGCVYKVRHRDLDEIQIVKTLQAHLSADEGLRTRFINEARRGMRLRHPHIAGVHDFQVCADGTGYIVMEYVHGLNLRDLLSIRGPLSLPLVGTIAVQTLDALAYLHSEKFVHRDISPDNLMLDTADGRPFVKLIDLGISKSLESGQTMTATGHFLGKVSYASPEQFGGQLDGRSDLYSLGVVLYKLLTNADPFTGANYREIISAHLFQPPRRFEDVAPDREIPEAVQRVIYRALEKDPEKRYADAAEFRVAVEEAFEIHDARPLTVSTRPARTASDAITRTEVDTTIVPGGLTGTPTLLNRNKLLDRTEVPTGTEVSAAKAAEAALLRSAAPTLAEPHLGQGLSARPDLAKSKPILRIALIAAIAIGILAIAGVMMWNRMEAARIARYGKFYAVVIGESQYARHDLLPTAVDDARAVAQVLSSRYGFDVKLLENAKRDDIINALRVTAKRTTSADNLLVYYAGHGSVKLDKGYWLAVDAGFDESTWISPATINDILYDLSAKRMLIIADSCYSGALARGELTSAAGTERFEKRSRMVISSGGDAPVIDSADGRHSIFTRALLEVLEGRGRKAVDVQNIFTRVHEQVTDSARRAGSEQTAQLAVLAEVGDEGGTFFFVPR